MRETTAGRHAVIRVLIADDHALFRDGIARILSFEPDLEIVGEASDGQQAVARAVELRPDVLLLDVHMPRQSGLEALPALAESCPQLKTVLLTASIDRAQTIEALRLGARGVVLKDAETSLLLKCVRDVMSGGYWVEHEVVSDLVAALREVQQRPEANQPMRLLTRRELQIVGAILDGATNEDIGRQFGMRTQTVKNHLTNIFDKVGVSSRLELALFALSHELLDRSSVMVV